MRRSSTKPLNVVHTAGLISRLAYARSKRAGIDVTKLLRRAGITLADINDKNVRLGVPQQIKFVELCANATGDTNFGFHLALDFDLRRIGLLYYVAASADTLGEAVRRAERYSAIINEGIILTVCRDKVLRISFKYDGIARYTDRHQIEFWITALLRMLRHLTDHKIRTRRIQLVHCKSSQKSELDNFFGSKIEDGAREDAIDLAPSIWNLPSANADPYLHQLLLQICDEALARRGSPSSSLRVRAENVIAGLLPHGHATIHAVATNLHLSSRQLARRLAGEHLTFATLLQELRKTLAQQYLADRNLSISQIAWLLGYKEVGTFTRASRRWTGKPPSALRPRGSRTDRALALAT